ncbi:MAG: 16S rRNA (guanine(966)-N(2))-methyltransferase RsmD [Clostridia bacterium]|nr:16S rRNA (guanine(966)-N(2))-methyltransferase RsmD [Clostridia bacterium]
MRIIAGTKRGHKLCDFEGMDIRPTTDRVKESMFNLIQDYVPGSRVLDLFAGSGALSFEAVSRGAKSAVCVDKDANSVAVIKKNNDNLGFDNVKIVHCEAMRFLFDTCEKFSVIFLDPPYNKGFIAPIIEKIIEREILDFGGIIVLESDFSDEHGDFSGISKIKQKKYGRSYVTVYKRG